MAPSAETDSASSWQSDSSGDKAGTRASELPADDNTPTWIQSTVKKDSRDQPWRKQYKVEEVPNFHKYSEVVDFSQCGTVAAGSGTLAA